MQFPEDIHLRKMEKSLIKIERLVWGLYIIIPLCYLAIAL